jgi:hypothetical protein
LQLVVEDNGKGFIVGSDSSGFGIRGMRKRADSISADLQIRSAPNQGTAVRVIAPMPAKLTRALWPPYIWGLFWEHRVHGQATNKGTHSPTYRR